MPAVSIFGRQLPCSISNAWSFTICSSPGLNLLEGVISQPGDLSIVTSQPRFDIVAVTQQEIDDWFSSLGFQKVATAAYYRADDNLGVFDAHDKNVIRAGDTLMPFDVIPCLPEGGFLDFIRDTLAAGHTLRAVRTTRSSSDHLDNS